MPNIAFCVLLFSNSFQRKLHTYIEQFKINYGLSMGSAPLTFPRNASNIFENQWKERKWFTFTHNAHSRRYYLFYFLLKVIRWGNRKNSRQSCFLKFVWIVINYKFNLILSWWRPLQNNSNMNNFHSSRVSSFCRLKKFSDDKKKENLC